ncbi:histidine kinase [Streptomyces sp. CBMA152]|uniref:sensor histidine kinase n=1 Tax=Streptomyces sp. CBMA152 TaxID=1896312 RepID=UPI002948BC0A|nr:histidine kinase [Streptomyces sp. CBMA152]
MDVSSRIRDGLRDARRRLAGPERWSRRRIVGESALALCLAALAGGLSSAIHGGVVLPGLEAAAVLVLSPLRRRFPAGVLVATSALVGVSPAATLLLLIVACSSGRRIIGAGRALFAFCGGFAAYLAVTQIAEHGDGPPLLLGLFAALFFMMTAVVPGLASRYWYQRRTLLQTMQERNTQLLRERAMVAGQARLRERQRIAQDMHDSLGHQLALISVHTGALEVDPALTGRQREAVGVLREASVAAMHELREVVGILRDGVEAPDHADEAQRAARGTAGVEALVAAARAAGTTVELRETGEPRQLAAASDHAAYRIVQEALTNAYKHAPGAPIAVELRYEPDSLVVEVVNGPVAGPPSDEVVSGGQGLTGLHERARLVGGMVHTGRTQDGGFRVAGVLPYGAAEAATFVDAGDDFRQQSRELPPGDGGPAGTTRTGRHPVGRRDGWDVDLKVAERELAMSSRSRGGGIALGCGIAFAAMVLLVVAAGFALFFVAGSADKGMIDPAEYEKIKVGTAEQDVRARLPKGDTFLTTGLSGKGPAEPAGSSCLVLMSSEVGDSLKTEPVFRFCFKDGKLIEKKAYDVER